MCLDPGSKDRINSFALVAYIPEPLAGFLDRLRQELVPNCFLRAHVTILPPRPCSTTAEIAEKQLWEAARKFQPFDVSLQSVEVFRESDVIYISISEGEQQLRTMHRALNLGGLTFTESYSYHPHITLAQNLRSDEVDELTQVARARWAASAPLRRFRVDKLTFVQATNRKTWIDLDELTLQDVTRQTGRVKFQKS
ncbi:MAG: 2'-5' RNA ligase family protein [Acidobacteriaceae bacterium]|nr:2'-5' RNA ligase family protein [Acidobacteriaceae bacterium]